MPRPTLATDPIITTLRTTRVRRGIHQGTIARATGVDRTSVTGWENGRVQPPLARLRAWAAALGYDLGLAPAFLAQPDLAQRCIQLVAERDRLILAGVNPDDLAIPIAPPEATP